MIVMVAAVATVFMKWITGRAAVGLVAPTSARLTTTIATGVGQRAGLAMVPAAGRIAITTIATVTAVAAVGGVGLVTPSSARPTTTIAVGGGQRAGLAMTTAAGIITITTITTVAAVAAVAVRLVVPPSATIAEGGRKCARLAMIAAEGMIAIATIAMVAAVVPPSARPTTTIAVGGGTTREARNDHHCKDNCDHNNCDCRSGCGGRRKKRCTGKTAVRSVVPPSATIAEGGRKRAGLAMIAAEGMIAIVTIAMVAVVVPPSARPTTTITRGGGKAPGSR